MACAFFMVDAFASGPFTGNPAGVCILDAPADRKWMQGVGMEVNQAETAFVWPSEGAWGLRWFTPSVEVDLCGHATLGAAHVLWESGRVPEGSACVFHTKSGTLTCRLDGGKISLDFPNEAPTPVDVPPILDLIFPTGIVWAGANRMDWFVQIPSELELTGLRPNMELVSDLGKRGLIVTAPASRSDADYVSRFFAPQCGVPEDHVTGSAHCALGPYWSSKLGSEQLTGYQCSQRGGTVGTTVVEDRVVLTGLARTVIQGTYQ